MTRNSRELLRDLARHRRDEEAVGVRKVASQLAALEQRAADLQSEIDRAELEARRCVADPFERDLSEAYLAGLRATLEQVQAEGEEKRQELLLSREALEKRVIQHRQMVNLHDAKERERRGEADRREEAQHDDLATGRWHRGQGEDRT